VPEENLGEPIRALSDLREPAPPGLIGRVRNSIQRRHLAADVADLSLLGPIRVFLEYLRALVEGLLGMSTPYDEDDS
jgi:hypothetical protein